MINLPYLGQVYLQYPYLLLIVPLFFVLYFFIIRKNFVKLKFKKKLFINRLMLLISRTVLTLFLIFALASPFNLVEEKTDGDPRLAILFDNSSSMDVFDLSFVDEMKDKLDKEIPTSIRKIGSDNTSRISDGILNNLDSRNLILITDGQNYEGRDLISTLMLTKSKNVSIWAMDLEQKYEDYSVTIEGPSKVVKDVKNEYTIKINNPYNRNIDLNLRIDGLVEIDKTTNQEEITFEKSFNKDEYRMVAEILVDDKIKQNNIYYKTIEVIDKPEIFILTNEDSPLFNILDKLYDVEKNNRLPNNLDEYLTIIIHDFDNLNNNDVNRLSEYANKGNGLFFIGGENSLDRGNYDRTGIDKILPVHFEEVEEEPVQEVNVVLLLDISGSTMFELREDMPGVNVVQGIAIDLIDSMDQSTNVGAIAFNDRSHKVSDIVSHFSFEEVKEKILDIRPWGLTDIRPAFRDAVEMLKNKRGSKNIILISDGQDHIHLHNYRNLIRDAADKDIILHTVNIGEEKYDRNMKILSDWSNGHFFTPEETNQFNVIFETPEGRWPLRKTFREHFITNELNIDSEITGFNIIHPKSFGQVLISTEFNDPILTISRYGLGRVAVLATDSGNSWGSSILRNDPKLFSRIINWGIENPLRNKEYFVDISDSRVGQKVNAYVKSKEIPEYQNYIFRKIDENLYKTEFEIDNQGFYEFLNKTYAINYHRELENIGMNEEYIETVISINGDVVDLSNYEKITEETLNESIQTIQKRNYLTNIFIILAISLLFIEWIIRRINRFKKVYK